MSASTDAATVEPQVTPLKLETLNVKLNFVRFEYWMESECPLFFKTMQGKCESIRVSTRKLGKLEHRVTFKRHRHGSLTTCRGKLGRNCRKTLRKRKGKKRNKVGDLEQSTSRNAAVAMATARAQLLSLSLSLCVTSSNQLESINTGQPMSVECRRPYRPGLAGVFDWATCRPIRGWLETMERPDWSPGRSQSGRLRDFLFSPTIRFRHEKRDLINAAPDWSPANRRSITGHLE